MFRVADRQAPVIQPSQNRVVGDGPGRTSDDGLRGIALNDNPSPRLRTPDTPPTKQPATVTQVNSPSLTPVPLKRTGIVVGPETGIAKIAQHFDGLGAKGDKALRLMDRGNGFKELYLHEGKASRLGGGDDRSTKQREACVFVKQKVQERLSSPSADPAKLPNLADRVLEKAGVEARGYKTEISVASMAKLESRIVGAQAAEGRKVKHDVFADGRTTLTNQSRTKMSEDGAGGAILVRTPDRPSVVLKIEDPDQRAKTNYVANLVERTLSEVATPFPFAMPHHESLDVGQNPTVQADIGRVLKDIGTDANASKKAALQAETLAAGGSVAKFEMLSGATVNKLPPETRQALFQDPKFAADLGKAAVLLPMLGFDDHIALDGFGGKANFANLMLTQDGRLGVIDYDALMIGTKSKGYTFGVTDDNIKAGVAGLLDFAKQLADPKKADAALVGMLKHAREQDYGSDPLCKTMYKVVNEGVDHLLDSVDGISDADFKKFAVNMVKGALEGIAYLRDNLPAFQGAHQAAQGTDNMHDPARTFASVAKQIDGVDLDALQAGLDRLLT
jgi:hypothetical protein